MKEERPRELLPEEEAENDQKEGNAEKLKKNRKTLKKILERAVIWGMITTGAAGEVEGIVLKHKEGPEDKNIKIEQEYKEVADRFLETFYGRENLEAWYNNWERMLAVEASPSENEKPGEPVVEGFEQIDPEPEVLSKLWLEEGYPQNWIKTEIDTIIYIDESKPMPAVYGLSEDSREAATATRKKSGDTKVTFYKDAGNILEQLDQTFAHESGHANDWDFDNGLSVDERKKLLQEVTQRYFLGENIFHSSYVEEINNPDPYVENEKKIIEYWAEICGQYFTHPGPFSVSNPEDFKLVDKWVKKQDPNFDVDEALRVRKDIIYEYDMNQEVERYIARIVETLGQLDPKLKTAIEMIMEKYTHRYLTRDEAHGLYDRDEIYGEFDDLIEELSISDEDIKQKVNKLSADFESLLKRSYVLKYAK